MNEKSSRSQGRERSVERSEGKSQKGKMEQGQSEGVSKADQENDRVLDSGFWVVESRFSSQSTAYCLIFTVYY